MQDVKKKNDDPIPEEPQPQHAQSDQSGSTAIDGVIDDVNDIINNKIGGGSNQRVAAYSLPCGVVSIDSSTTNSLGKVYTVKYGGETPCGYRKKSGDVVFELQNGTNFSNAGAIFSVTFINYVVEVLATSDIVTINGTVRTTNLGGGYVWESVTSGRTIRHKVRGTLNITYANSEIREKKYFKLRTWTSNSGWEGITLTVAGDTSINSVNVSETGRTLKGDYEFKTEVYTDFLWSNCGTTYAGPYVLKFGRARINITVEGITPTYVELEAGYKSDIINNTHVKTNNCESNAYKIETVLGSNTTSQYQLY